MRPLFCYLSHPAANANIAIVQWVESLLSVVENSALHGGDMFGTILKAYDIAGTARVIARTFTGAFWRLDGSQRAAVLMVANAYLEVVGKRYTEYVLSMQMFPGSTKHDRAVRYLLNVHAQLLPLWLSLSRDSKSKPLDRQAVICHLYGCELAILSLAFPLTDIRRQVIQFWRQFRTSFDYLPETIAWVRQYEAASGVAFLPIEAQDAEDMIQMANKVPQTLRKEVDKSL
jgi:hypothetical protein